jgi:hypothetical protein
MNFRPRTTRITVNGCLGVVLAAGVVVFLLVAWFAVVTVGP